MLEDQIILSTLDEEKNYYPFWDIKKEVQVSMPAGTYRVVDGELYLIVRMEN